MTENGHIQAKYFEDSDEDLNGVKRTVIEALRERGLSFERIEVRKGGHLNLRIDVFGLSGMWGISMDCLIEVANRVEEMKLGSVYRIAGKSFPPDFDITGDEKGLRLTLWF